MTVQSRIGLLVFCLRVIRQLQCRHNPIFVHDQYAGSSLSVLVNADAALLRLCKYKLLKSIISYNSSNYTRCWVNPSTT